MLQILMFKLTELGEMAFFVDILIRAGMDNSQSALCFSFWETALNLSYRVRRLYLAGRDIYFRSYLECVLKLQLGSHYNFRDCSSIVFLWSEAPLCSHLFFQLSIRDLYSKTVKNHRSPTADDFSKIKLSFNWWVCLFSLPIYYKY